jgi:dolichyl-diphosphooligosaccharide--protein glycosyltransferase
MAKSGKGGRQARKEKAGLKPEASGEKVQETTTSKPEAAREMAVAVEAPQKAAFDAGTYLRSGAWIYPAVLLALMALMFYVRVSFSYDSVFTDWDGGYVNVAQDDAVYHMRLVYNTLAHFPERIFYDPFTHYPFGSPVHFGPLFTLIIAGASLIVGLGQPGQQLVATVGAYTPVVLGILCAIPTYFMGKKLFGRNAGIVAAATLALMPGQFLGRSMLGFTDHHIAEVLFSVAAVAFLVYALDAAKKSGLSIEKIRGGDREALTALALGGLAGVAFGCYMLTWPGGLLVGFMLFVYFAVQSVVDHMRGEKLEYLAIIAALMFLVPAVMLLPYSMMDLSLQLMYYSATQPVFLALAFAGVLVLYGLSRVLRQNKVEAWSFPVALLGIGVIGLLLSYILLPQMFALIMAGFKVFTPSGGMLWVAEAKPSIFDSAGNLNLENVWFGFFWTFYISIIAIVMLAFRVYKNNRPAEWLFLVWNLVMFLAMVSQIRFTYYFAANAALLTGYFVVAMFRAFDSGKFVENFKAGVSKAGDLGDFLSRNIGQASLFAIMALVFALIIVYPATSLSIPGNYPEEYRKDFLGGFVKLQADGGPGMGYEWYKSLTWLRDNTPDPQGKTVQPGFDYAGGTYRYDLDANGRYKYPDSAYGVMSWWDYGHIINYVGHRIANANPFQAGILENNGTGGSARFFLATTEDAGYSNLQNLGSKYVMIDYEMATGKHHAITVWADDMQGWEREEQFPLSQSTAIPLRWDSQKFKDSMTSRLYYDDCDGMSHFRLVYESPGQYITTVRLVDLESGYSNMGYPIGRDNYTESYEMYQVFRQPTAVNQQGSQFVYDARAPVKYVKTYEVVKGATLTGSAPAGSNVTVAMKLGIGARTFNYTQTVVADQNGVYSITVPYATEDMKGDGYSSDVQPLSKYTITYDTTTKEVDVPERAVANGETIKVS